MITDVSTGIRNKLIAASAISALVSTRVYNTLAEPSAALPYIVFQYVSGGYANQTPQGEIDLQFQVSGWSESAATAAALQAAIDSALHQQTLTIPNWVFYDCAQRGAVWQQVTINARQYWQGGGTYRIRATR